MSERERERGRDWKERRANIMEKRCGIRKGRKEMRVGIRNKEAKKRKGEKEGK